MSERKPGWYWVKDAGQWECLWYNGLMWDGQYRDEYIEEIGPRIPTPDDPWQCVPVEPTPLMASAAKSHIEAGHDAATIWRAMLMYAPRRSDA